MATAGITGVYFPVGVALCRLVNQHRRETGVRCAARPSGGSVANLGGLRDGVYGLAIVQSDAQAEAVAGSGAFAAAGPFADLRRGDGALSRAADPRRPRRRRRRPRRGPPGKRLWLGPRARAPARSPTTSWRRSAGATPPSPRCRTIGAEAVADALCRGDLDAFLYAVGHPALVIQEATTGCDARLVAIDGPAIDALVAARPELIEAGIPGGLYRGNPADVASFGAGATLVTRRRRARGPASRDVDEIFADLETLRGLEPVLAELDPQRMATDGLAAPLHPAAERYFRERGWID